jgi:hypothetical protein
MRYTQHQINYFQNFASLGLNYCVLRFSGHVQRDGHSKQKLFQMDCFSWLGAISMPHRGARRHGARDTCDIFLIQFTLKEVLRNQ